jgi:hypothetical protein
MSKIVIVTSQCYLLAEAINYIAINEVAEDDREGRIVDVFDSAPSKKRGRKSKRPIKLTEEQKDARRQYQIVIDFVPANGIIPTTTNVLGNKRAGDTASVGVKVTGRKRCLDLFSHMVEQIREQIPDNKFLDQIVENFLQETNK